MPLSQGLEFDADFDRGGHSLRGAADLEKLTDVILAAAGLRYVEVELKTPSGAVYTMYALPLEQLVRHVMGRVDLVSEMDFEVKDVSA